MKKLLLFIMPIVGMAMIISSCEKPKYVLASELALRSASLSGMAGDSTATDSTNLMMMRVLYSTVSNEETQFTDPAPDPSYTIICCCPCPNDSLMMEIATVPPSGTGPVQPPPSSTLRPKDDRCPCPTAINWKVVRQNGSNTAVAITSDSTNNTTQFGLIEDGTISGAEILQLPAGTVLPDGDYVLRVNGNFGNGQQNYDLNIRLVDGKPYLRGQ